MEIIGDKTRNILFSHVGLGTRVQLIQPHVNIMDTKLLLLLLLLLLLFLTLQRKDWNDNGKLMATLSEDSIAESSTSSSNSRYTPPASANLLSVLWCPKAAELARKHTIDCNPPKEKELSHGEGVSDPKSVAPC